MTRWRRRRPRGDVPEIKDDIFEVFILILIHVHEHSGPRGTHFMVHFARAAGAVPGTAARHLDPETATCSYAYASRHRVHCNRRRGQGTVKARGRRAGHVRRVSSQGRAHSPSSALEGRGKLRGVRRGEVGSALWRGPWGVAVPVAAAAHAATSHRCLRRRPPRRRGCVSVSVWVGVTRREFGRVPFRAAYVKARYCYDLTYVPSRGLFYARSLPHAQRAHASPGLSCAMSLCARSLFGLSRSAVSRSSRASSYRPSCIVDIARFT